MNHRLFFLLLMLKLASCNVPLNFESSGDLYVSEKFFHLEINLGIDKVKNIRSKVLNLDRLAVNLTGKCQYFPIEDNGSSLSQTKIEKVNKHYNLLKDLAGNIDSLFMNDIRNSFEILGLDITFSDEGEDPIKGLLAKVRSKREIPSDKKFVEFRNHILYSQSSSLNRHGTVIVAEEENILLYIDQIRKFNSKYSDFKSNLKTLDLTHNKNEVCELMIREADSLSVWGRIVLKDFERIIRAIALGSIPNRFFTDQYITSLQSKLDATEHLHSVRASEVNKHDFAVKFENNVLHIVIFIPLHSEKFELYKFNGNFPLMRIQEYTYSVKLDPIMENTYLAIGDNNSNRFILSQNQINECLELENEFYCPPYLKFKSPDISKTECITNLWNTNNHLILETCNLYVKRVKNFFEEVMPNCLQINLEEKSQITTLETDEEGDNTESAKLPKDWDKGIHTVELSKEAYLQIGTSSQSKNFDPTGGEHCTPEIQTKINNYWNSYSETLSEIDQEIFEESRNLYVPLSFRKSPAYDYLKMHLYSAYSHLHIILTIIVFTFIKWSCVKLIHCISTKSSNLNDYEFSSFKRNAPKAPVEGVTFYPSPPPF